MGTAYWSSSWIYSFILHADWKLHNLKIIIQAYHRWRPYFLSWCSRGIHRNAPSFYEKEQCLDIRSLWNYYSYHIHLLHLRWRHHLSASETKRISPCIQELNLSREQFSSHFSHVLFLDILDSLYRN